jgi:hypothetical protein
MAPQKRKRKHISAATIALQQRNNVLCVVCAEI